MFQRQGVILKGGMPVGLGRMARIARFGEQREVGQPQAFRQRAVGLNAHGVLFTQQCRIDKAHGET